MKKFDIPAHYRSELISKVKEIRKQKDPRKKDFNPTVLDFGAVRFLIARHFGFCYGVENAIEISYKAIEENQGKRIYLLSQMIHNPIVNADLEGLGIQFLQDTLGNQLIPFDVLTKDDVVIIPAFGTTLELEDKLSKIGVDVQKYNTTCPFVEKVWKRSAKLGADDHTIIIHGKNKHEETRATFSHSSKNAPSIVVKDLKETQVLADFILGKRDLSEFAQTFEGKYSENFDPSIHFEKLGVINQTTMLATETQEIADYVKQVMVEKYGEENIKDHFADTRDTLCYATNDNQSATLSLMEQDADMAIVVGGYNSSNTSHLVELLEQKFPTYYISSADEIKSETEIHHFNMHSKTMETTTDFFPKKEKPTIILTSGASCPDAMVDKVLYTLLSKYNNTKEVATVLEEIENTY
ncbi:4-hydroxy-3-methylbut-2-enyl diphosphate reductase [Lishizhenia tianjinensis]|uniref:4-hydroxy-3-methylbut-2-enyl diphosphate reductase n=1 Tax=Lishizhenia tianjinensis TaxID=477690 RepID=A0A1I6Y4I4_9FLAO|nr:4-hydroxy-3-methylbut-2-enyl diphosphate reductase [Lishizhenia tianjinensis]SFT45408.1 4-hydroxy-3-methylbut-2-enyl diphosphate reductase [Lishizhenia tianjinensis]